MIKPTNLFIVSGAVIGAYFVHQAYAVGTAPAAFSQYGQIQAVQNYSSNPFWHPGSPYNQKAIPKPIYVTGADLNTGDCNRIVENLVASFCASNNNCVGMRLADVRPTIMVQLSQLPGHNFATSCGGYIDSMFNKYAKSGTALNLPLPTGTTTGTATFQFKNPYEIKPTAEQQAVADRAAELAALQAQTGGVTGVSAAAFPKTLADLSFTDRMANAATGYEPYKDKSAYAIPNFEDENSAEFLDRLQKRNPSEYCKRFPNTSNCKCYQDPTADECQETVTPVKPTHKCPDPEHMDTKCEKCITPGAIFDEETKRCKCKNNGDIDNNCQVLMPVNVPACLAKIRTGISVGQNETPSDIEQDSVRIKQVADAVYELCIIPGLRDLNLATFNNWLSKNDNIPITVGNQTLLFNAEKVFAYINLPTSILFSRKPNLAVGGELKEFGGDYIVTDKCSDKAIGGHSDHKTTVHLAATATGLPHNCEKGITYFVDYPIGKARRVFPGLLLESCASFMGQEHLIRIINYKTALSLIKDFTKNLTSSQNNMQCSAQGLYLYLVQQPIKDYTRVRYGKEVNKVDIIAGPYAIP